MKKRGKRQMDAQVIKKIKVLQFPVANSKGGITQYVLRNWEFIDKTRFQFDFVTMSPTLDFEDKLIRDGCKVFHISCYAETDRDKFISEFRKILKDGDYDIVHLHTKQWKSFLVEELAREAGVRKIIVHAHNTGIDTLDDSKREHEMRQHNLCLEKLTEEIATDYWACSEKAADFIFGNKIPKEKIKIMNNAIDLQKFAYKPDIRKEYRRKFGLKDEFVIGNVGRFVYQKNQEFLLEVFSEIIDRTREDKTDFKLLLIGSGEREEEYKRIVEENRLKDKVIFVGQRTDVPELLQVMDVFCLPSRFEGLPISMIEAQAVGLPCIGSNCITDEIVLSNLVQLVPLETSLWIDKILALIGMERRVSKLALMQQGYDIVEQIKEIESAYGA